MSLYTSIKLADGTAVGCIAISITYPISIRSLKVYKDMELPSRDGAFSVVSVDFSDTFGKDENEGNALFALGWSKLHIHAPVVLTFILRR